MRRHRRISHHCTVIYRAIQGKRFFGLFELTRKKKPSCCTSYKRLASFGARPSRWHTRASFARFRNSSCLFNNQPPTLLCHCPPATTHALSFLNVKLYFGNGDKPVGDAKISGSRVSPVSYLCASDGLARRLTPEARGVRRSGWMSSKYGDRTRAWRAPCRAVRTTRRVR